ncbi:anti-sigma factor [Alcaligenaceae bacterium]|nr:anti-sigma factor [Alcaligenaceae bacterium]
MSSTSITVDDNTLIAEYTLGLLNLQETAQAQTLLGSSPLAAMNALKWESCFLELVDLLPPAIPGPQLLRELQASLGHAVSPASSKPAMVMPAAPMAPAPAIVKPNEDDTLSVAAALRTPEKPPAQADSSQAATPAPTTSHVNVTAGQPTKAIKASPKPAEKSSIWLWRAASAVFALIAIVLAVTAVQPTVPPVTVVEVAPTRAAIMQAPGQSSTPGWVLTLDPEGNILMQPKVRTDIPSDASAQLWTHNQLAPQPRSLGLIDPNRPVTVPASLMGEVAQDQIFEITQEPAGGSTTASPSGPILFIGRMVTFGKPALAPSASDPAISAEPSGS